MFILFFWMASAVLYFIRLTYRNYLSAKLGRELSIVSSLLLWLCHKDLYIYPYATNTYKYLHMSVGKMSTNEISGSKFKCIVIILSKLCQLGPMINFLPME